MAISWSGMRKQLEEENICESLKGRVRYFATRYRKSNDNDGRIAILIDGKEVFKSNFFDWHRKRFEEPEKLKNEDHNYNSKEFWDKVHMNILESGSFDQFSFYKAFHIYNNQSVEESLISENPIVRLLVIFDKRIGKRRLLKIAETVSEQPEWFREFYKIRLFAENITNIK